MVEVELPAEPEHAEWDVANELSNTITIDGRKVDHETVMLPKATWITDGATRAVATLDTTCGHQEFALTSVYGKDDERRGREDNRKYHNQSLRWKFNLATGAHVPRTKFAALYIDNTDGMAAASIRVGGEEMQIAAGASAQAGFRLGECEQARHVSIDGHDLGELPSESVLVDVSGSHCYVVDTTSYGERAGRPSEPTRIASTPTARLHSVPTIQTLFDAPPSSITVSVQAYKGNEKAAEANAVGSRTSLTHTRCARRG